MDINENNLIEKYLKGDEKSLEILIQKYLRPIYNFVYSRVGSSQEAEDITQDTFVKMWKNLKKFEQQQKFSTWLYAIAGNTAIDYLRKKKTIPFSAFSDNEGNNTIIDNLADENVVAENNLAYAVEKLSPEHRDVISMHNDNRFTFKEMANILREPMNTVKSRYRRAITNLKKNIK
jgi:RNA polymerase sigma-70 factor, ECF subfamily